MLLQRTMDAAHATQHLHETNNNQPANDLCHSDLQVTASLARCQSPTKPDPTSEVESRCKMSPSTRTSFSAPTAGDDNAKEVTAIMNDLAVSKNGTPSKRKRGAKDPQVPNESPKRRVTVQLTSAPNTVSPRRSSRRLQSRISLPALTPALRADEWELPVEENDTRPRMEPIKKLRPLNKQKETTDSPFKGYGVLDPKGNARVNLDDSPANNTRGKWLGKISQSLQRTRNTSGKPIKVLKRVKGQGRNLPTRLVRNSIMEEDPIEAAARDQDEPLTPGLGSDLVDGKGIAGPSSRNQQRTQFSPLKADARRGKSKRVDRPNLDPKQINGHAQGPQHDEAGEASDEDYEEGEDNQIGQSITQLAEKTVKAPPVSKAVVQDTGDEDGAEIATPDTRAPRPETEAERRGRVQAEKEEIEKTRSLRKRALKGVKKAVEYHGLVRPWTELLTAMLEIEDCRSTTSPTSIRGKGSQRPLDVLLSEYEDLASEEPIYPGTAVESIGNNLRVLKERIQDSRDFQFRVEPGTRKERKRLGEDMYQHLLPSTIRLAKIVLKARFRDEELSFHAHKEIIGMLNLIQDVASICMEWTPRPELVGGIKALTKTRITTSLHSLIAGYEDELTERHRDMYLREFNARQMAEQEEWNASIARKRAEVRLRHQESQFNPPPSQILYSKPLYTNPPVVIHEDQHRRRRDQVLDIDDIMILPDGDAASISASRDPHRRPWPSQVPAQAPPPQAPPQAPPPPLLNRLPSEDIPDPAPQEWSEEETVALVNALQQYTAPRTRFRDIMADQGSAPYGILARFDMDDLVAQAKWIKASMKTQLEGSPHEPALGSDFDFLRSVPG